MSIFTSQGTVRMHCDSSTGMSFTFVPSNDYSIKRGDDTFAVFVGQSDDKAIIRKYTRDNGVDIDGTASAADCKVVICSAAVHQVNVEVRVEANMPDDGTTPKFTGITVPAK